MSDVRSKNLYELLGNDSDQDSDREPEPPAKAADKPVARSGKRNAGETAPTEPRATGSERGGRGGRRGGYGGGNDDAFRDRNAGSASNRSKPTDDGIRQDRHPARTGEGRPGNYDGPRGRGRGGRGSRGRGGDRQDRSGLNEHQKQADQSWGATTGDSEWKDEQAGEAIAKAEETEGGWDSSAAPPVDGEGIQPSGEAGSGAAAAEPDLEAEPEDNSKSYADYLAEQAAKKVEELGLKEARKPNEGSKQDKKWAKAKELKRSEEEAEYFAGEGEKARRERERKTKNVLDIDYSFQEQSRGRGDGRGRARGDRGGRGSGRGRGEGGYRGRGDGGGSRGRGEGGFRGRGEGGFRGGPRGGRGDGASINVASEENFPSLGSK